MVFALQGIYLRRLHEVDAAGKDRLRLRTVAVVHHAEIALVAEHRVDQHLLYVVVAADDPDIVLLPVEYRGLVPGTLQEGVDLCEPGAERAEFFRDTHSCLPQPRPWKRPSRSTAVLLM